MKIFKRIGVYLIAICLAIMPAIVFVGCESNNDNNNQLSFEYVGNILKNYNDKQKPFLATLEFKYKNTENEFRVKTATNSISSLSIAMSESMKSFQTIYNEYITSMDDSIEVSSSQEEISIKIDNKEYLAKLNKYETDLYIYTKDNDNECVYEIKANSNGGYLLQIISRNQSETTYTIYQMIFNGTNGKLCIDERASMFSSFYLADISNNFPYVDQYIFSN